MRRICATGILAPALVAPAACPWVKPTPASEGVRAATADAVAACERKGKVTVSLKSRVAGVERKPTKVANELSTLARNEGALLGGDTVVAEGPVSDGRQVFGVYHCNRRGRPWTGLQSQYYGG